MDELSAWLLDVLDKIEMMEREHPPYESIVGRGSAVVDPAVIARVEAERAMTERLVDQLEWLPQPGSGDVGALSEAEAACYRDLLRWLAYGHRHDAPGWREEWVPERVR